MRLSVLFEGKARKGLLIILFAGLALRLAFIPFTMHSDLLWVHLCPSKLSTQGVLNVYEYMKNDLSYMVSAGYNYYAPPVYFLFGLYHVVIKAFCPGLGQWLGDYQKTGTGDYQQYVNFMAVTPVPQRFLYISLMKLPYLVFDLLCLLVLIALFTDKEQARKAYKLWMLNPVVIFATYIFGQFDIVLALMLLLVLLALSKGRSYYGFFLLGCSMLIKSAAMVLIAPLTVVESGSVRQGLKRLLFSLAPVVLIMAPFVAASGPFALTSLFPKFLVARGAHPIDTVEFTIGKLIFLAGFCVFLAAAFSVRAGKKTLTPHWALMSGLIALSYFIIYSPVHYVEWIVPFLIIGVARGVLTSRLYISLVVFLFIYALNSRMLSTHLFLPLDPAYVSSLPGLPEVMARYIDWGIVMRLSRYVFYLCLVGIIWKTWRIVKTAKEVR